MTLLELKQYPVGHLPFTDQGREIMMILQDYSKGFTKEQWNSIKVERVINGKHWELRLRITNA